jgi:hypothetical protein
VHFFSGTCKTYITSEEGSPRGSHTIMTEWGRPWAVPSQVRVVWPSPDNLHELQTFPASSWPHAKKLVPGVGLVLNNLALNNLDYSIL